MKTETDDIQKNKIVTERFIHLLKLIDAAIKNGDMPPRDPGAKHVFKRKSNGDKP